MLQVTNGVVGTTVEMVLAAVGFRHRTATVASGGQDAASASIRAIALLIRTDDRLVVHRGCVGEC